MLKRVSSNCTENKPGILVDKRLVDVVGLEKNRRKGKNRERTEQQGHDDKGNKEISKKFQKYTKPSYC